MNKTYGVQANHISVVVGAAVGEMRLWRARLRLEREDKDFVQRSLVFLVKQALFFASNQQHVYWNAILRRKNFFYAIFRKIFF
jgi:hypothetical protein